MYQKIQAAKAKLWSFEEYNILAAQELLEQLGLFSVGQSINIDVGLDSFRSSGWGKGF